MADLRECFEAMGFSNVQTYIQSGNVVFTAKSSSSNALVTKIETGLNTQFNYTASVVVLTGKQIETVLSEAPKDFNAEPNTYRYDVIFCKLPTTPDQVLAELTQREGVDTATAGTLAVYFKRVKAEASKSYLPKFVQSPLYKQVTIRNANTSYKLLGMVQET